MRIFHDRIYDIYKFIIPGRRAKGSDEGRSDFHQDLVGRSSAGTNEVDERQDEKRLDEQTREDR